MPNAMNLLRDETNSEHETELEVVRRLQPSSSSPPQLVGTTTTSKSHLLPAPIIIGLLACFVSTAFGGFACLSNPCLFGVCIDDLNSTYSCYCIDGYTGIQCQTNWDECWSSPCDNGGTCIDGVAQYNCSCPEGFAGQTCEENLDECLSNPCQNDGVCHDKDNGYTCTCTPGYLGRHCENDVAVCETGNGTRCENGGDCVEGPGLEFSCKCASGWDGVNCESEIDECASSPCQNGGVCIDKLAGYACACLVGFTGSNCEETVLVCEDSPCENNALCLMEEGQPVCYCVPDYHGEKCEYQYDECQLGPPRCTNGGTCIDGVDNFSCSCPPHITGMLCECLMLTDNELDCNYTRTTDYFTDVYDTVTTYGYTIPTTAIGGEISTISSTLKTESTTSDINFYTSPSTTSPSYSVPTTLTSIEPSDATIPTTSTTTLDFSALSSSSQSSSSSPTDDDGLTPPIPSSTTPTTTSTEMSSTTVTDGEEITTTSINDTPSTFDDTTTIYSTTFHYHTPDVSENSSWDTTTTATTTTPSDSSPSSFSTPMPTTFTPTFFTQTPGMVSSSSVTTVFGIDGDTTTRGGDGDYSSATSGTTGWTESTTVFFTPNLSVSTATQATAENDTTEHPDCRRTPCQNGGTCVNTSEGSKCVCRFDSPGPFCELPLIIRKAAFAGDSYLSHQIMPENYPPPPNSSGSQYTMQIELKARTRATDGLIILASTESSGGNHYMALFLHRGLLQFQFSCGLQTMLLSELEAPVNTGDELLIQVELDFSRNHSHCNASLRVNDTLAMSGDQPTWLSTLQQPPGRHNEENEMKLILNTWLHLGGAPQAPFGLMNNIPGGQGFTGCLHNLKINGKSREIFSDAMDGFGITECGSLACLSNPCRNGAICIEKEENDDIEIGRHHYGGGRNDVNDDYSGAGGVGGSSRRKTKHQKESSEKWKCKCPTGYMGVTCEISVCDNNPCQYGGTCVTFPGSGYLCLCPLGKHGHYCEHNLEIAQPSFSGSVKGLSSYVAYPVPVPLEYTLELSFKILPTTISQISLLAFFGQTGYHDEKSDHMAISFIQGYIMLTWNLGGGPRRIFLQKPIEIRGDGQPHQIKVGRIGRKAWLSVDGKANITGRSPGTLTKLDVIPILYLGGHEHANFSTLPHDLPLHSGFQGCIFDVQLKAGMVVVPLQDTKGMRGRGVGQCGTRECHRYACQHEGACLQYGATFTCICQEGWFGPLCAHQQNLCDSFNNKCSADSFCMPLVNSYECDCPTGKSGRNCETHIKSLSDISLSGRRSFLSVPWPKSHKFTMSTLENEISHQRLQSADPIPWRPAQRGFEIFKPATISNSVFLKFVNEAEKPVESPLNKKLNSPIIVKTLMNKIPEQHSRVQSFSIELQVRPLSERGLLIFFGSFEDNVEKSNLGFVSLSLQGGVVEFRIAGPENHLSVVRSSRVLAIGEWHKIKMSQNGKRLTLWVEGSTTQAVLPAGYVFLNHNEIVHVGGLPDLSKLPYNAVAGFPVPFRGCVRQLVVSGVRMVLNETNILASRNILDCDGTACGGDSCELGGHCWLDERLQPHCKCPQNARGDRCQIAESCNVVACKNGGRCMPTGECSCRNGWGGYYCEIATSKYSTPSFRGSSYLVIPPQRIQQKDKRAGPSLYIRPKNEIHVAFKFSTIHPNGLLLWSSHKEHRFLGLGIENGHLKLASSLLGIENATVDIPAGGFVADGGWHSVLIDLGNDEIVLSVDERTIFSERRKNIDLSKLDEAESVSMEDTFYIGGSPSSTSISNLTINKFSIAFSGCLQDVTFGSEPQKYTIVDYSHYEGENIGSCELFDEFMN